MRIGRKLTIAYFDLVYNPLYDFTTARLAPYRRLQRVCIDKLEFEDGDKVLCVGVGTGNEILRILEKDRQVTITGVDTSSRALSRAYQKAAKLGKEVKLHQMDAGRLEFDDESFNKALCLHVIDFVEGSHRVATEILRILKKGGQFVLTYPSAGEGLKLGINLLKESLHHNSSSFRSLLKLPAMFIGGGIIYLPLFFRGNRRGYSLLELEALFAELKLEELHIEEERIYQDFIVYGRK